MPSRTSSFSTFDVSKRMGKLTASRTAMTLGLEEMKGPGGILVRKTVDWCFSIRVRKKVSRPWM